MLKITNKEFARRRQQLMAQMEENSIAILPSAPVHIRNRDVEHKFRQDSDFYYLSGFPEAESVLVLIPGREHGEAVLFCRERDTTLELWHGYRYGQDGAIDQFAMDDAFPISDIDEILPGLIEGRDRMYYAMGYNRDFDNQIMTWVNTIKSKASQGAHPPGEFLALDHLLHDLRLYKSSGEVKLMREAGAISSRGHIRAMELCEPGVFEYQLEAELNHEFQRSGSRRAAYPSIVGSGNNGCILHYTENDSVVRNNDLVLIDAGCELDYYASDITRTFPANGRFNKEQRALYELVLKSQLAAIEKVQPGNHWNDPHEVVVEILTEGLLELGLLEGELSELITAEACRPFYMHRTGHWLGMDVHDVGDYKVGGEWRVLEPGMVLTIEPGIYIAPDYEAVPKRWRGIGIRIEDDVVVTRDGHEVLSAGAPKQIDKIESLMATAKARRELTS